MGRALQITVSSTDDSDIDWLTGRCVLAVENEVDENEDRMDGQVTVDWEYIDVPD